MTLKTMDLMNANYLSKRCDNNNSHVSILGEIEKNIINAYIKTPHTKEELENFETNIYGNSVMFNDDIHKSVDSVYPYWNNAKKNIQIYDYENEQHIGKVA